MSLDCILGHEETWQVSEEGQGTFRRVEGKSRGCAGLQASQPMWLPVWIPWE